MQNLQTTATATVNVRQTVSICQFVRVVRCGECAKWAPLEGDEGTCTNCPNLTTKRAFYCADGVEGLNKEVPRDGPEA